MRFGKIFIVGLLIFVVHKYCVITQPFGPILSHWSFSKEIVDRQGRLLRLSLADDQIYRIKTKLSKISPLAINATLLYEDRYFYWHLGVNPIATIKAIWTTYVTQAKVVGASTITMQLSRALYQIPSRTVAGKLMQMARAIQLELLYSKTEILEAYLNTVPYGFNVEGIGAASRIYFQKPPQRLSLLEALTLAVIPQSPFERTRHIKKQNRVSSALKSARKVLLNQWLARFPQNAEQRANFELELDMRHPQNLPFHAPHLVTQFINNSSKNHIRLNIDLPIQKTFNKIAKSYIKTRHQEGIRNASALLIDTRNMESLAYLGSGDFYNNKISGQVNGVRARRSPGSALKPFAYGLAIDQGFIHPLTMLKDAPTPFGTYTPDNFDRVFAGPLSSTDALIHSRNIPAILLTQKLSQPSLYEFLQMGNIPLNPDPLHYGLSIVLGTAEVTMEELIQLYATLNNEGKFRPIRKQVSEPSIEGSSLLSPEASFLILDMLTKNPKPDNGSEDQWRLKPQSVAWKTGTSVGFRDAWAVALFDHYALAVWVGNFSGQGNSAFVGRHAAGPLLFSLIEALAKIKDLQLTKPTPSPQLNITEINFCALSGHLPHKDCLHQTRGWFIPEISPIRQCYVHRKINIDPVSGLQVCLKFQGHSIGKVFEYWPTDLLKLFKQAGVARRLPPKQHASCRGAAYGDIGPKILSPKINIIYNLRSQGSDSKQIPLLAVSDGNVRRHSWYINNQLVGHSKTSQTLIWKAKAGRHVARVVDDLGRSTDVNFNVLWVD